jgi:hypothetical protein
MQEIPQSTIIVAWFSLAFMASFIAVALFIVFGRWLALLAIPALLTALFVALRLLGLVDWSWPVVLSPILVPYGIAFVLWAIGCVRKVESSFTEY